MTVENIPARYRFVCDGCGVESLQNNNSRPKHWSELHINRHAYDFSDCAVADASVSRLLCSDCSLAVYTAVNTSIETRKAERRSELSEP